MLMLIAMMATLMLIATLMLMLMADPTPPIVNTPRQTPAPTPFFSFFSSALRPLTNVKKHPLFSPVSSSPSAGSLLTSFFLAAAGFN